MNIGLQQLLIYPLQTSVLLFSLSSAVKMSTNNYSLRQEQPSFFTVQAWCQRTSQPTAVNFCLHWDKESDPDRTKEYETLFSLQGRAFLAAIFLGLPRSPYSAQVSRLSLRNILLISVSRKKFYERDTCSASIQRCAGVLAHLALKKPFQSGISHETVKN